MQRGALFAQFVDSRKQGLQGFLLCRQILLRFDPLLLDFQRRTLGDELGIGDAW